MEDEDLQCFVCFRNFADATPIILSCGHSLCADCVEVTLSRNPVCPTCNKPEVRPASTLPTNFQLRELAQWNNGLCQCAPYLLSSQSPPFSEDFLLSELRSAYLYLKCNIPYSSDREVTFETNQGWIRLGVASPQALLYVLIGDSGVAFIGQKEAVEGDGWGLKTWAKGDRYFGEMRSLESWGVGKLTHSSGVVEEGRWEAGKLNGFGVRCWSTECFYHGQFRNHEPCGFGYQSYSASCSYVGFWQHGQRSGRGVVTSSQGSMLSGHFDSGTLKDLATIHKTDGRVVKGKFRSGIRDGAFVTIDSEGRESKEIYSDGSRII